MNKLLAVALMLIFLAPLPPQFAINYETKQCGTFWGGDEWVIYTLPPGWEAYFPQGEALHTKVGVCTWTGYFEAESCCNQLGYTFIGPVEGSRRPSMLTVIVLLASIAPVVLIAAGLGLVIFLIYKWRKKQAAGKAI